MTTRRTAARAAPQGVIRRLLQRCLLPRCVRSYVMLSVRVVAAELLVGISAFGWVLVDNSYSRSHSSKGHRATKLCRIFASNCERCVLQLRTCRLCRCSAS